MNDLMTKSFTSYVDLKKAAMKDIDLEAGLEMASTDSGGDMVLFLEEAEKVKSEMGSIREILGKLQQANEETKSAHKPETLKSLRHTINVDIVTVLKKARSIRSQLEEMDRTNAAKKRISGSKEGSAIYRY